MMMTLALMLLMMLTSWRPTYPREPLIPPTTVIDPISFRCKISPGVGPEETCPKHVHHGNTFTFETDSITCCGTRLALVRLTRCVIFGMCIFEIGRFRRTNHSTAKTLH